MQKKFSKVYVEISNICNLKCSFCPKVERHNEFMGIELFEKVISEVAPLADQVCLHLMGEPLTHPKLVKLIEICHHHLLPINLTTNGVLLNDERTELLLHPAFRQVNFSLHSFTDNFHDKDFSNYLSNIFRFTKRAFIERPELYVNYRLWNLKSPRSEFSNNREMLEGIKNHFSFELPTMVDVRTQKSLPIKNRLYLHFDTEFSWPSLDLPALGSQGTCYGLTSHFGILVDGTVVPCCLDQDGAIALGKIQDLTLIEILSQTRAQKMISGFRSRCLAENLCQRCQFIERFQ